MAGKQETAAAAGKGAAPKNAADQPRTAQAPRGAERTAGATASETKAAKPAAASNASTGAAALAQERRRREAAEAALATERAKVAALEAEQRATAEALKALTAQQRRATVGSGRASAGLARGERAHDLGESAAETAGAVDGTLGLHPFVGFKPADVLDATQQLYLQALRHPLLALKHSTEFFSELSRVMIGRSAVAPDAQDTRFVDPMWAENPMYRRFLQGYLAWRQSLNAFVDEADLSPRDAERARFALSLLTEAAAPTNTLLGNPAAMKKLYESGGTSAVRGVTHMIEDLARNGGLPSQVNMKAFQVGKDLALSPGAVVYQSEVFELIQYTANTPQVYSRPVLVIPPQINKFYIMDLAPGKSLIEYAVKQGLTLFAISWRNPTPAQREWGLETYTRAIIEALDVVRAIAQSADAHLVAAWSGGMTAAAVLGHLAAAGDTRVGTATLLATVLDATVESQLGLFATPEAIAAAKQASKVTGVLEGQEMARVFAWMRPNDLIWNYWVNNYLIGNEPPVFDILYWNNDTTRLPARFHADLLDQLQTNAFRHPGALRLLGTPIDLSQVKCDTYITSGITDHITPWQACYATTQMLGGRCEFVVSTAGHIQSVLNPPGNPQARFHTGGPYPADPEQWMAGARQLSGSWWDHWGHWLRERSGPRKPAPSALGNAQYEPGAPAPGTYVFEP